MISSAEISPIEDGLLLGIEFEVDFISQLSENVSEKEGMDRNDENSISLR